MRKVLIISYMWPPMEGVGLMRALKFAKYLPMYGWEPLILTVKVNSSSGTSMASLQNIKVYRTEYRDRIGDIKNRFYHIKSGGRSAIPKKKLHDGRAKKNILTYLISEIISVPDYQIGWYRYAVKEGRRIIDEERIDMIFSTSPPETTHLIARALKKYCKVPWVADLRDLWTEDHFRSRPLFKRIALRFLERSVLKDADALITVSEPWAQVLRSSLGQREGRVEVIENGYDEEDFTRLSYVENKKFTITYTGKLHDVQQPLDIFFKVLSDLIKEGLVDRYKIEIQFYVFGYDKPDIATLATSYSLDGIVKEFERVNYNRSLEIQRSSDILLFVQWIGKGGDGCYSTKIYDYIGAHRPILALASAGGIIDELVTKTSSGIIASNESSLREALLSLYDEYIKNGYIKYGGNDSEISKLTRKVRTKKLADIFDSFTYSMDYKR